jgi:hypothetical protein
MNLGDLQRDLPHKKKKKKKKKKDIWRSGGITPFLTSALVGGKLSASCPGRFTPGETEPGTLWIGGWVGPRAGLDTLGKRKILSLPGIEPGCPAHSLLPNRLELSQHCYLANYSDLKNAGQI